METKKKSNAGRKPLPAMERLTVINIFVKKKHLRKARLEAAEMANKYR